MIRIVKDFFISNSRSILKNQELKLHHATSPVAEFALFYIYDVIHKSGAREALCLAKN